MSSKILASRSPLSSFSTVMPSFQDYLTMADPNVDEVTHVPSIVATCQQTRFHILEDRKTSGVSVERLTVSILPPGISKAGKAKSKAAGKTLDVIVDADLKLKPGVHYGLLGRNGSGKSTLLRAIATKVIPGLPISTRIAILQQTGADDDHSTVSLTLHTTPNEALKKSALQYILENDIARNEIQAELNVLSLGEVESGGNDDEEDDGREWACIRAYRQLQYNRMQRQLAELQKNAALRSGARGSQARKGLLAFEKQVEEAKEKIDKREPPLDSEECQRELVQASQLLTELQAELDERRLVDLKARALNMLSCLGFSQKRMQMPLAELSGGWQMRCMLASVLLQDVDIMILDEPTNFLDLLGIVWLQKYLVDLRSESTKTVVVVSHDLDFIDGVCEEIILIQDKTLTYFSGNLTAYEEDLKSRRLNLTRMKEAQDKQIAHMEKTIAANIKAGKTHGDDNKLRQAVSRQKRLEDRTGMQVNAKGGRFKLSRDHAGYHESKRDAIEIPPDERSVRLQLPLAPDLRFPGALASLDRVTFAYDRKQDPVLRNISLSIHMGSRVGIVGLNGCGKSTLVKLLTDVVQPTKGTVSRHPRLRLGYYSQQAVEDLQAAGRADPAKTALSTLAAEVGDAMDEGDMRALLGSFGLAGSVASNVPVVKLSGGQLVRLALACIVWNHPHLLVLDEITTHLDFYTVVALSRALKAFNGALLIVSHDRFLIKSVIEENTDLLGLDDEEEPVSEEKVQAELKRSLYVLKKGGLVPLEHGVREFEKSLEKRVAKLTL